MPMHVSPFFGRDIPVRFSHDQAVSFPGRIGLDFYAPTLVDAQDFGGDDQNITFPKFRKVVGEKLIYVVPRREERPGFDGNKLHAFIL